MRTRYWLERAWLGDGAVVERVLVTVDDALADLKEALKPESGVSAEELTKKVDTLNEESQKMGAALYAASAEQGEGAAPGGDAGAEQPAPEGDDDIVDAEVVDDDEEKK